MRGKFRSCSGKSGVQVGCQAWLFPRYQTHTNNSTASNPVARQKNPRRGPGPGGTGGAEKDADLLSLEESLSEQLGLKVQIATRGKGGSLTITYKSLDQLDDVLRRLTAE